MSSERARGVVVTMAVIVLGSMAHAEVSSDRPLVTEGFEFAAGSSIHGRGIWTDPRALFRVSAAGAAQGGQSCVRVETTEFADYNLPGFRNRWGGWIGFAQGALGFAPGPSEQAVLTIRGFVRLALPDGGHQREVRAGIVADDDSLSTVADVGLDSNGRLDGVVVYAGNEIPWRSADAVARPSDWSELVIRLDLTAGLGRLEWNGNRVLVFSHTVQEVARMQLGVDGRRSAVMPYRAQGAAEFDSVSAVASWHCEGDLNLDRVVDDEDFGDFVRVYNVGDCVRMSLLDAACAADFNRDQVVDEADFALFAARYDAFGCP